ncbi:unnamed protein product [Peronospora destructor]|uniref:Uncharacterized protein n=1 Tax=Peronospora destructor TaxID=86335 RepID=A0AAV0VBA3_9STRA|nr:unnamed protein product [Peronospora destructor]
MDEEVEAAAKLEDVSTAGVEVAAKHQFDTVLVPKVQNAVVSENEKLIEKKKILEDVRRFNEVAFIEKTNVRVQKLLGSLAEKCGYYEVEELSNVEKKDEACREFATLSCPYQGTLCPEHAVDQRCGGIAQGPIQLNGGELHY